MLSTCTGLSRIDLRFVENHVNCLVFLEEDGHFTYEGRRYAPNDPEMMKHMRASCVRKGASVWTNLRQKEAATQDVIEFLHNAFAQ